MFQRKRVTYYILVGSFIILSNFIFFPDHASSVDYCCRRTGNITTGDWIDLGMIRCPSCNDISCPLQWRKCSSAKECASTYCESQSYIAPNCNWPLVYRQKGDCNGSLATEWLEWQIYDTCDTGMGDCFCGLGNTALQPIKEEDC